MRLIRRRGADRARGPTCRPFQPRRPRSNVDPNERRPCGLLSSLLTGPLEPTNEWYAIAKIAGVKLCQAYRRQYGADYISVMPTNAYSPGDNYHPENGHVIAALIRRVHVAKQSGAPTVSVWGAGTPRREFIFVDDLADACVFVLEQYSGESPLNVGTGEDITIADLARLIAQVIGYAVSWSSICHVRTERRESYSTCPSCGRLAGRHIRRLPSALSEVMPTFFPGMGGIKSESHHQRPATMANVGDELRWQADF
jgi:nucleoside-diphosphate-sugar epimerase